MPKRLTSPDTRDSRRAERVDGLQWTERERREGKRIKIRGFPKHHKLL